MPSGVIAVTQLEFRVTGAAAGTLYADCLQVGTFTSRIEKVDGWALNNANRLTWTLAQTNGLTHGRIAVQTNEPPSTATNGTVASDRKAHADEAKRHFANFNFLDAARYARAATA